MNSLARTLTVRALLCVLFSMGFGTAPAEAEAQLPGYNPPSADAVRMQFQQVMRERLTPALQDWTNLWERNEPEAISQYYTERALFFSRETGVIEGREAIREMWREELPWQSGIRLEIHEIVAGETMATVAGRTIQRVTPADGRPYQTARRFMQIFEQQRGRWLIRAHYLDLPEDAEGLAVSRAALRANRASVAPPERVWARLVTELMAGHAGADVGPGGGSWSVIGGGLGLDLGGFIEIRGHAWRDLGSGDELPDPLRAVGGELRLYPFSVWRLRPNLLAGIARFDGTRAPDTAVVPVLGGGMGIRINDDAIFHLAARNYLPQRAGSSADTWVSAPRDQRWLVSGGMSYAVGSRPTWSEPVLPPERRDFEASFHSQIVTVLTFWHGAVGRGDAAAMGNVYAAAASLHDHEAGYHVGGEAIQRYWTNRGGQVGEVKIQPNSLRVSGNFAVTMLSMEPPRNRTSTQEASPPEQLLTVLEREADQWRIRMQVVLPNID
ncbi:hypothetical protein BH23GEM6_BH23GEM6_27410 [soil metagenome]